MIKKQNIKNRCNPTVQRILALLLAMSVVANALQLYIYHQGKGLIEDEPHSQNQDEDFVENNCIGVKLPDCDIYVDKRLDCFDGLDLRTDNDWLYKCKLYKDFGWYPNAYLVYTSIEYVQHDDDKSLDARTNAYFLTYEGDDNMYIYVWNTTESSILHEFAHFADYTHDTLSQSKEWAAIYEKEWKQNTWLLNYKREDLNVNEQYALYLKESFAESFSQWYCDYYEEEYSKNCSTEELASVISHTAYVASRHIDKDAYPLTYEYMQKFYENYEFNDAFLDALSQGYTSIG